MQSLEDGQFDPIGSNWDTAELLTVNSFYPKCIPNTGNCGYEPCVEQKTCAQVNKKEPYLTNDFKIKVQLPNKICEHCVIQWRYVTSNSCDGSLSSCISSEKFWNCADIQLFESQAAFTEPYSINVGYIKPPDAPVVPNIPPPEDPLDECIRTSYDVSDAFCKGVRCDPTYSNTCTFLRNCRSDSSSVTDEYCQSLKCSLNLEPTCTTKEKTATATCHSTSPAVPTSWCIINGCQSSVCAPGPDPSAIVSPTVSPTFGAPTIAPTSAAPTFAAPTIAPTFASPTIAPTSAAPTVAPTDAPTNTGVTTQCTNAQWNQCGGINYNGETCCPDGMACEGGLWWKACKIIATQAAQQSGNSSSSSSTSITHVIVACLCVLLFASVAFLYWLRSKTQKSSTAEDEIETGEVVSIVY